MRNSRLQFILALGLGLIAAFLVWNYSQQLQQQVDLARQAQPIAPTPIPTADVVVATQDLPARTILSANVVKVIQIPAEEKLEQAFSRVEDVDGKTIEVPVVAGEQILSSKFAADQVTSTFADSIPAGKRAVAFNVNEIIGAGGLIVPGNFVDVIVTYEEPGGVSRATVVLQNVQVLALSQSYDRELPAEPATPAPARTGTPTPGAAGTPVSLQKTLQHPDAHTVTLALAPDQAEQMVLAEEHGTVRLALRRSDDSAVTQVPDVVITSIPASPTPNPETTGTPQASVTAESTESPLQITEVNIAPTTLHPGDILKVEVTVKNTSDHIVESQGPDPQYTYVQGQTYFSQNFPSVTGKYRVGLTFNGHAAAPYPYRWGLGGDLQPGASTTIVGLVKMTYDVSTTTFWAGIIQEPADIVLDQQGQTLVTVLPANVAVIVVHDVHVRSGPDTASSIVDTIDYGTQVPILGQVNDWYRIKLPDGREGYVAAGWIVAVSGSGAQANPSGPAPTPTPGGASTPALAPTATPGH
jgi:pilus assembly protein CpaB